MNRNIVALTIFMVFLFSCKSNPKAYVKFLNTDSLPSQYIEINNSKDTIVKTANGALLKIGKGSFSSDRVKLQVKEAYSIEEMILAGLTTESNGKPLSSGGMIYIGSIDRNIKINKPINISIPTNFYDSRMNVYKGEEKDGKINWIDPQALSVQDSLPPYLQEGKLAFQQNCTSCHSLDKDITAPALSGTENRGPWKDRNKLLAFTRNPAAFMARSCYAKSLKSKYQVMMTGFPQLDANAIYDYIRNEDYKKGFIYYNEFNSSCEDSCWRYDSLMAAIKGINDYRQSLIESNGERINVERIFSSDTSLNAEDYIPEQLTVIDKIEPVKYKSIYYQFTIKTFDWYNVDYLMDKAGANTELKVETKGKYKDNMSVFLIVPDKKVFAEGGPLKAETNLFGFYTRDGKISLPVKSKVIVFAVGESDGQITFDYKKFISTNQQRIILEPEIVSKKEFNRAVKKFRLDDASLNVQDSKNAEQIRKQDQKVKTGQQLLELYRPRNCDCNCGNDSTNFRPTALDSTVAK